MDRFSNRTEVYVRYRPGYPPELIQWLRDAIDLESWWIVADIGCGTGLLARRFLDNGHFVYGVEPNRAMRETAEEIYAREPHFASIDGTAEATTLPGGCADLVCAGQAFHWFDADAARREWRRILSPGGRALVVFNSRRVDATPFMAAYDSFLTSHAVDYQGVDHRRVLGDHLRAFLGECLEWHHHFQLLHTYDEVRGLALSSSYVPADGHPRHAAFFEGLRKLFDEHEQDGVVAFPYDCEAYLGRLE